jgi:CheY-like chemotaxis protein
MLVSSYGVERDPLLPRHTRKGDMEGGSIHRLPDLGSEARASVGIDARSDSTPARLLIADDHALLRTGMRAMLEAEPDLEVVGEAGNGREAVELCLELLPDLVLMDLSMPEMGGIEATRAIKAELPRTGVLVLTAHADQEMLLEAIRAGAAGYVLKGVRPDELVGLVRASAKEVVLKAQLTGRVTVFSAGLSSRLRPLPKVLCGLSTSGSQAAATATG